MTASSFLVRVRARALDAVFRIGAERLNDGREQSPTDASALAADLRAFALFLQAEATDPATGRRDFHKVAESAAYREFRAHCISRLAGLDLDGLQTDAERLAFWLNLYNALVIDGVLTYGVRESVKEARGGIARFFRRTAYDIGGLRFSLDDIEHGLLRANRGHPRLPGQHFAPGDRRLRYALSDVDPRLHFALNCGAVSCPPVRAYRADELGAQLAQATANYLSSPSGVRIGSGRRVALLPKLFDWYRIDFGGMAGVREFAAGYLPEDEARALREPSTRLYFRPYDWSLA